MPDLLILTFPPLEQFTTSHKDYLQLLKDKVEFIARVLLDYETQSAQDIVMNASMYQKVDTFLKHDLLYLLAQHISSLQTGTTRF